MSGIVDSGREGGLGNIEANDPERTSRAIAVSHGHVDNEQPNCYPAMTQDHHLRVECLNL